MEHAAVWANIGSRLQSTLPPDQEASRLRSAASVPFDDLGQGDTRKRRAGEHWPSYAKHGQATPSLVSTVVLQSV